MTHDVKVIFASGYFAHVQISRENALFSEVGSGDDLTKRIDDATASTRKDGIWLVTERSGIAFRIVGAAGKLIAGKDETPAFQRDMLHGSNPGIAPIRRRSTVELNTFGIHRHTQERHVVFPADHRTESSDVRLKNGQRGPIAKAPDKTFRGGRHELAMLAQVAAIRREEQHRTVEGASVTFNHSHHEMHLALRGDLAQHVNGRPRNIHRTLPVPAIVLTTFWCAGTNNRAKAETTRVGRNKCFRENDQLRSPSRCVVRQSTYFFQCALAMKGNGGSLNDGGLNNV